MKTLKKLGIGSFGLAVLLGGSVVAANACDSCGGHVTTAPVSRIMVQPAVIPTQRVLVQPAVVQPTVVQPTTIIHRRVITLPAVVEPTTVQPTMLNGVMMRTIEHPAIVPVNAGKVDIDVDDDEIEIEFDDD